MLRKIQRKAGSTVLEGAGGVQWPENWVSVIVFWLNWGWIFLTFVFYSFELCQPGFLCSVYYSYCHISCIFLILDRVDTKQLILEVPQSTDFVSCLFCKSYLSVLDNLEIANVSLEVFQDQYKVIAHLDSFVMICRVMFFFLFD